jgi:hypothetical protein
MSAGVAQRGRERRPERHVQVAPAEGLHLQVVADDARPFQAAGEGNPLAVGIDKDRVEDRVKVRVAVAVPVLEAAIVDLDGLAVHARRQVLQDEAFAAGLVEADPAVAVGVGEGVGLQADLQADHLDQAAAEHVRRVASGSAVLGHGHAGASVAIRDVMARAARVGVRAVHHLGGAVGQQHAFDLAVVAVDAVALAEVTLRESPAPGVAEPGIDLLQVHRSPFLPGSGRVHHTDARNLDRQPAQIARHVDGVVERVAGPFGLLSDQPVMGVVRSQDTEDEASDDPDNFVSHSGNLKELPTGREKSMVAVSGKVFTIEASEHLRVLYHGRTED